MKPPPHPGDPEHEPPPFGTWRLLYAIVIAGLALTILLLGLLTRAYT